MVKATGNQSINLYSGNNTDTDTTLACSLCRSNPITGVLDIAGYPSGNIVPSSNMVSRNSTQPADWQAVQDTFCQTSPCYNTTTCHYSYEQLHTLATGGNSSLLLVSCQRYPFNPASDKNGLIRISRLGLNNTESSSELETAINSSTIYKDDSFVRNGIMLYSPAPENDAALPPAAIPFGQLVNQTHLTALYPGTGNNTLLARFPPRCS